MDCAGEHKSACRFHHWVNHTLLKQRTRLETLFTKLKAGETPDESDYLPTRFTVGGELGDGFWWDFQLDGYGAWLWTLAKHIRMTGNRSLWDEVRPAVEMTIAYLRALWRSPNYDCWSATPPAPDTSVSLGILLHVPR